MARSETARETPLTVWTGREGSSSRSKSFRKNASLDCGWGNLIFAQTFEDHDALAEKLVEEPPGRRNIAMYVRDPHVLVARGPQELFLDPSYTYRLWLEESPSEPLTEAPQVNVRSVRSMEDADAFARTLKENGMLPSPSDVLLANACRKPFEILVCESVEDTKIQGVVMGVDHREVFDDPEEGSSLWTLAVSPHSEIPGVGERLTRTLAARLRERGCRYMDLSVMFDNAPAIALYEKIGFERVPAFAVKVRNPINEPLFIGDSKEHEELNPYARIIADEARRRGILVEIKDAEYGLMELRNGGRSVLMRESLSELTTAVAMTLCDDKRLTRRIVERAGVRVPRGREATFDASDRAFLEACSEVVVKPVRGEQGNGVSVGVRTPEELERAIERAQRFCNDVLLEEYRPGQDLRIVVIDHEVVAASLRVPAYVVGTGDRTIEDLIRKQSRRREASTGGESRIPIDDETRELIGRSGYDLDDILPLGEKLTVCRKANLHAGGTLHDVTAELHPALAEAAVTATRALSIPVCGIDFIIEAVDRPEYVMIEANERPGLANHEPQPTAERYLDLLFPDTSALPPNWEPEGVDA